MERAYSYERVSSGQQVQRRGLGRQSDAAAAWAKAHGITLDTSLALSDRGRSASKGEHLTKGALGRFLAMAQAGQLGDSPILLVEAIDRLSRQEPLDAIETILTGLVGSGVRVITLEDGAEYSRESLRTDPTRLLVLVVKMQAAYEYTARLAMRVADSWEATRRQLKNGQLVRPLQFCPFWCSYDPQSGFTVIEERAAVVRELFQLLRHQGVYATAKELNARGLLSPAGKRWSAASVHSLVINSDAIYGAVRLNSTKHDGSLIRSSKRTTAKREETIEGLLPVIVPREEVMAVRALMAQRNTARDRSGPNGKTSWIGQGITRCTCGARRGLKAAGIPPNYVHYLVCFHRRSHRDGCRAAGVQVQLATAHLLRRLEPDALAAMVERLQQSEGTPALSQQRDYLQQQLSEVNRRVANLQRSLVAAAEAGDAVTVLVDQLAQRQAEATRLEEQLGTIETQVKQRQQQGTAEGTDAVAEFRRAFATGGDTAEQRRAVNRALRSQGLLITIDGDGERMGLQLADGPIEWQRLRQLDRRLLWAGRTLAEVDGLIQES